MSAPDPRRVEEVFDAAAALPADAVARYLEEACADDGVLRREVEALLACDARVDRPGPEEIAGRAIRAEAALEPTLPADAEPRPDHAPRTIGRFEVSEKIGEGGMGVVYEAVDPRLDRRLAVKLVRFGLDGIEGRARLLREAQAMAKIAHPNVVAIYEVGILEHEVFVAMELVPGETLSSWLRREPRAWRDALVMFVAAGRGLAAAHAAGIVHRDFKPDNVLVGADGRPRVVDFGLARAHAHGSVSDAVETHGKTSAGSALSIDLTTAGAVMGTPGYMSPEHFRGQAIDPRSDQFSFAVALYRALFGAPPFAGGDLATLRESVFAGPPPAPPSAEVPPVVTDALLRALSRDPGHRFASMNELLDELERPLALRGELDPSRSRNKRRLASGLLALAALATLLPQPGQRLDSSAGGLLELGLVALAALLVIGLVFRRMLLESAYNRRVAAVFVLPVIGFVIHRALAVRLGSSPAEVLGADAVSMMVLLAFAGLVLERWMAIGALSWLAYAAALMVRPALAGPAFGGLLLVSALLPIWLWREPKSRVFTRAAGGLEENSTRRVGSGGRSTD